MTGTTASCTEGCRHCAAFKPHPAKTVLTHHQMADRPKEATERSELGHFEMDTVVSSINGIHRLSLGGKTATQRDEELAKAA